MIIGIFHILISILLPLYAFIISINKFDIVYIIYTIIIYISWTFYNGECAITYYSKLNKNPNYIAGDDTTDLDDIYSHTGYKDLLFYIVPCIFITHVSSLYIVLLRNKYSILLSRIIISTAFFYYFLLRYTGNKVYENTIFMYIQELIKYILILCISIIICTYFTRINLY